MTKKVAYKGLQAFLLREYRRHPHMLGLYLPNSAHLCANAACRLLASTAAVQDNGETVFGLGPYLLEWVKFQREWWAN